MIVWFGSAYMYDVARLHVKGLTKSGANKPNKYNYGRNGPIKKDNWIYEQNSWSSEYYDDDLFDISINDSKFIFTMVSNS